MVRIAALAFAAALPLASATGRLGMPKDHPVKADHIGDAPIPTLPGTLVGYVNYGLSESSCTSSYPTSTGTCTLESYQLYPTLSATPIAYGDRLIIQSSSPYSYYKTQFTSLSPTLQNLTTRNFDLRQDCAVPLYTPTLSYGAMQMPPRPVFQKDPVSGNGSLVPEVKDLRMQILAFNTSDNYTLPNQTYFRVYDVDMSREAECRTTEVGPDVEKQREMNLGVGSLRCAVRADVVDSNITGVVRSTHHALVVHDLSGSGSYATCRGTDSRGYQQSCHRLVSLTSYSNGTKGDVTVRDLTNFPLDFTFDSATPCFYDNNTDAIALVGTSGSNDAQILRIDNLKNMYYTPTVTTVRTLDSSIVRSAGSLMNTDGNIGFLSGNSLLVYSLSGDKLVNKTIAVAPSTYSTLQYPVYTAQRSVIPGTEE